MEETHFRDNDATNSTGSPLFSFRTLYMNRVLKAEFNSTETTTIGDPFCQTTAFIPLLENARDPFSPTKQTVSTRSRRRPLEDRC